MSSYDKEVATRSGSNLTTDDHRRTRFSNDFVRQSLERKEWWGSLLKLATGVAVLATSVLQILHYVR
jgi:hypothetical protein